MKTGVAKMFGLDVPIFAFSHCRDVVVEATNAGGMGVLGTTRMTPEELEWELKWIDDHTGGKPYGLDLALPNKMGAVVSASNREVAIPKAHLDFVEGILKDAGVPPLPDDERKRFYRQDPGYRLTAQGGMELVEVALKHPNVKLVVSALGVAPPEMIELLHRHGIKVGAVIGSVRHARKQLAAGVDVLVAQGMEAGAHTGDLSSMVLWPQVVDAVGPVPVLAAGGVGRGRQMAAAIALGAQGVWCGSVWLGTRESELSPEMRGRLFAAASEDAIQRKVFTGKQCRILRSKFTDAWDAPEAPEPLPMPLQPALVGEARERIERAKKIDYMSYYVGQIVGDMKEETSVRGVIQEMLNEFVDATERMNALMEG